MQNEFTHSSDTHDNASKQFYVVSSQQRGTQSVSIDPIFVKGFEVTLAPKQSLFYTPPSPPCPWLCQENHLLILAQPTLQGKDQKPRESWVLPPSHQVPPLQFEVSLVPSLHHHQPGVGGGLPGHVLVTCEGRDHRPTVENQTHLRQNRWEDREGEQRGKAARGKVKY